MTQTYSDGTVSVANGSSTVTGSGTAWAVALITGGVLHAGGATGIIASVDGDTAITLTRAWAGPTLAGAGYDIELENAEVARTTVANRQMADIVARIDLGVALGQFDEYGTLAERDSYDDAAKGFRYARTDDPSGDLVLYVKASATSGDWDGPYAWRGEDGSDGTDGKTGGAFAYEFDGASQAMADPGDGYFRLNHATPASATAMAVSAALLGAIDVSALIAARLAGTSAVKARVAITSGANRLEFDATAIADNTDWLQITLANGSIVGTLADAAACEILFDPTGDKGDTGDPGADGADGTNGVDGNTLYSQGLSQTVASGNVSEGGFYLPSWLRAAVNVTHVHAVALTSSGSAGSFVLRIKSDDDTTLYGPVTIDFGTPVDATVDLDFLSGGAVIVEIADVDDIQAYEIQLDGDYA